MQNDFFHSVELLRRTPEVLRVLLDGVSDDLLRSDEGQGTWSPKDVVGHLVVCEESNWMQRIRIILSNKANKTFGPVDKTTQSWESDSHLKNLLERFARQRSVNLHLLMQMNLTDADFKKTGTHREIGPVTVEQIFNTWVAHDLAHTSQITRVMAKQYKKDMGPFITYMPRLNSQ